MKKLRSNRGATLLELIASVAVLSIVGFAAFTLLMFSIRTNDFIVDGSVATKDAELLNRRFDQLFEMVYAQELITDGEATEYQLALLPTEEDGEIASTVLALRGDNLYCGDTVYCEGVAAFKLETVYATRLVRISYTIGERAFVKLFRLQDPPPPET
jgi:type II secretory pathway pseudopilin PulG